MANPSVTNVVAALPVVTGGILRATLGTPLATDASVAVNAAFKSLGYVGDGGLSNTVTRTTDPQKAWGGDTVANLQSDFSEVWTFTFLESLNPDVNKAVWGDQNVTVTPATSSSGTLQAIAHSSTPLPPAAWTFEMFFGAAGKRRVTVPIGSLALSGDVTYVHSALVSYPVTLTALPDSAGHPSYEYIDDGVFTA